MRLLITFLSVIIGIGASALEFAFNDIRAFPENSPERNNFIFDTCITFYAATYGAGRLFYLFLKMKIEVNQLNRWSSIHMIALHAVSLIMPYPILRPGTFITGGMAIYSLYELLKSKPAVTKGRIIEVKPRTSSLHSDNKKIQ